MAGAGFKTFATGDVLTASDVNTYLMQQTVMVFASAAARSTALGGNVAQGMISYLKDSNTTAYYDGTAWQTLSTGGDITGVTAGTGISGGGTSGDVTVTNSMATAMTTKGDLVPATGSGTFARLAAGSDGSILVANSAASTGLAYTPYFVAGKNKVINGDFGIWQRGTSFTINSGSAFTADRYQFDTGNNTTVTQQTFTPGTAPVSGYEGTYYLRFARTSSTNTDYMRTKIEDVRTLAGQTVMFSMWLKASSGTPTLTLILGQNFGSGGSANTEQSQNITLSTSWTRYTFTTTLGSMSGKTIGSGSHVYPLIAFPNNQGNITIDTWGWQLEAGSVATPFTTATGTIQGELAACQRYYYKTYDQTTVPGTNSSNGSIDYMGASDGGGNGLQTFRFPVTMRTNPTITFYRQTGTANIWDYSRSGAAGTGTVTCDTQGQNGIRFYLPIGANWTVAQLSGHLVASAEL